MKVRDLIRELRAAGGKPVRTRGSHQQWVLPDGRRATLTVNHLNADAGPAALRSVRRALGGEKPPRAPI